MKDVIFSVGKTLMALNIPLWIFITFVSLPPMQQYSILSLVIVSAKETFLSKIHLPTTVTKIWIQIFQLN